MIIIGLAAGGFIFWQSKKPVSIENLLKINSTLQMNETQQKLYQDVIEGLRKDPGHYKTLFYLARLKQDLLDYEGAIELYERLTKERPGDILIWNNLGAIYYNQEKYEKAEEMQLKILSISAKWYNAYEELFTIYQFHLKDKRQDLEKILLRGLEEYPEMKASLLAKLAVYYDELMNNKEKAIEYYEKALKENYNETMAKRLKELKKEK